MTTPAPVPAVRVTGGTGGITANRDELEHLATLLGHDGETTSADGFAVDRIHDGLGSPYLGGPLGSAGNLDAAGLLRANALLADGAVRLRAAGDQLTDLGHKLSAAAQGYPWGSSVLSDGILAPVELLLGRGGLGITTSGVFGAGVDPRPRQADAAVELLGLTTITSAGAPTRDGRGVAVPTGAPAAVTAPRRLVDVVDGLAETNRGGGGGGIDVRLLVGSDGARRAVVDITGTRTWRPGGANPADVTTNSMALLGRSGAYSHGVLAALRRAGVRSDEPVMLVGHSQGGMVAVTAARDAVRSGEFRVTHVVTAGSPIARTARDLPASVRVLALENSRDVVPSLDGHPNPDRRNIVTVSGAVPHASLGDDHDIGRSYRALAEGAQQNGGRSVRDFLHSARSFFDAASAERHPFRVERR